MAEIPKPFSQVEIRVGWPRTLLLASLIFFVLSVSVYFVLAGYVRVADRQSKDLDKEIQDIAASLPADEIQKLIVLDSQIKNLKGLLPNHVYLSRVLEYLEVNTLPRTKITGVVVSTKNRQLSLQGVVPDTQTASLQAASFEKSKDTAAFSIKSIGTSVGGLGFIFEIFFNPSLISPR